MQPDNAAVLAARVRAARGYSGMKQKDLGDRLGLSVETMSRVENGRRTPDSGEVQRIAELCGVPMVFMETGWALIEERSAAATAGETLKRVAALEEEVRQLVARDSRRAVEERLQSDEAREPASRPSRRSRPRPPR